MTKSEEGWIEWNGGECPVAPDAHGALKFRDGYVGQPEIWVGGYDWRHSGHPGDIIAYRVVKP